MRTRFRTVAAGVAATALVATSIMGISSASAEVIDISGPLGGALKVNGKDASLPAGASVTGTFDDVTGDLALSVAIPQSTLEATVGADTAVVTYELTSAGGVNGTVDLDDGTVTADGSFELALISADLGGTVIPLAPCKFAPINIDFTGTLTETVLTLSSPAFEIPGSEDPCGGVAAIINPQVAGTNNSADLSVDVGADVPEPTIPEPTTPEPTTPEPTTPPATTPPATTPPAAGAQPVAGSANYTG